jgi:hydrogenase expression/formation protein HypC
MCLAVPGKILKIYEKESLSMGQIDFGGVLREACLVYVPEAETGNYVIVHAGFAISLVAEQEALETLELLKQLGEFNEEMESQENEVESA